MLSISRLILIIRKNSVTFTSESFVIVPLCVFDVVVMSSAMVYADFVVLASSGKWFIMRPMMHR